jgi:hypothetical protein
MVSPVRLHSLTIASPFIIIQSQGNFIVLSNKIISPGTIFSDEIFIILG